VFGLSLNEESCYESSSKFRPHLFFKICFSSIFLDFFALFRVLSSSSSSSSSPLLLQAMRGLLQPTISRADAVFNIQRMALMVDSLHRGDLSYLVTAAQDKLHQVDACDCV